MDPLEHNRELLDEMIRRDLEDMGWEIDPSLIRQVLEANGCNYGLDTDPDRYIADGERFVLAHLRREAQKKRPSFIGLSGKEKDILTFASEFLQTGGYYTSHEIDSLFFFYFDPEWTKRKADIRHRFAGRQDPFSTGEEYVAWFGRWSEIPKGTSKRYGPIFNEVAELYHQGFADPSRSTQEEWVHWHEAWHREEEEYEKALEGLMADYGVTNDSQFLELHIWQGTRLDFPYARIGRAIDERGRPCVQVEIYSQHALEKLPSTWRVSSRGEWRFYDLPYIGDRLAEDGHSIKETREPSMKWQHRVRAWCIYYLSKEGGGHLKAQEAIREWNSRFPQYQVTGSNYHGREKKRVLQVIEWWLTSIEETRELHGRKEGIRQGQR